MVLALGPPGNIPSLLLPSPGNKKFGGCVLILRSVYDDRVKLSHLRSPVAVALSYRRRKWGQERSSDLCKGLESS